MKKRLQWASVVCDFGYSETNCPTICNHFRRWTIVIWDKFLHQVQRPSTNRKNSRTIPLLHKLGPWWRLCVQMTSWIEFQLKDNPSLILVLYIVQLIWTSNTNPEISQYFCLLSFFLQGKLFQLISKHSQKCQYKLWIVIRTRGNSLDWWYLSSCFLKLVVHMSWMLDADRVPKIEG